MAKPTVFMREATGLVRQISPWKAFLVGLMSSQPSAFFLWILISQGLFPGANLYISGLITFLSSMVMALLYTVFAICLPRSGGDYVYVGRMLHPSLGFMVNFMMAFIPVASAGSFAMYFTTFGLAPMFSVLGALYGNPSLTAVGAALSTPQSELIIGVIITLAIIGLMFLGLGVTFRLQNVFFVLAMFGLLVYLAAMFGTSPSSFATNFNSLAPSVSSPSFNQIIAAAHADGININFSWYDTWGAIVFLNLGALGYISAAYTGGEVKNPKSSMWVGIVGGLVFYVFFMMLAIWATYVGMGQDFLASIGHLATSGNANYKLPAPLPVLSMLAGYGTANSWILILGSISWLASMAGGIISNSLIASRCVFAWAFDAVIPTKFADVNERFHTPQYALLAILIVETLFVYLTIYTPVTAYLAYNVTGEYLAVIILGLAAIAFPYGKWKGLFEASPSVIKAKILGVPWIVILGIISIPTGIVVAWGSFLPQIAGPFNPAYLYMTIGVFIGSFIYYWLSFFVQKRRGIPVQMMHSQIPPE